MPQNMHRPDRVGRATGPGVLRSSEKTRDRKLPPARPARQAGPRPPRRREPPFLRDLQTLLNYGGAEFDWLIAAIAGLIAATEAAARKIRRAMQ